MLLLSLLLVTAVLEGVTAKLFNVYFQPGMRLKRDSARQLRSLTPLQLDGSVDVGYFYTHIELGTPPQIFSVIPDTGSALTYVPCGGCDSCGTHEDEPFDYTSSSTFHEVECHETACSLACKRSCCTSSERCRYTISYTEGSSVVGNIVQDHMWLLGTGHASSPADRKYDSSNTSSVPIAFGCDDVESGEIFRQAVDGIAGLADDPLSIAHQLAEASGIGPEFTVCFGQTGGSLFLGSIPEQLSARFPPVAVAPRSRSAPFYNVRIQGLMFGSETLNIDLPALERGYGTIFDTGTTFTYLPSQAHGAFVGAFAYTAENFGYSLHWDTIGTHCFSSQDLISHADLAAMFPNITLVFSKDSSLPLTPRAYLFQKSHSSARVGAATWCLGFLDGGPDTATIGAITIRDVAVTFDNDQRELRFRPVHSCLEFSAALLAETSAKDQNATAPNSSHHSPAVVLAAAEQVASTTASETAATGNASHVAPPAQNTSNILPEAQEDTVGRPEPHPLNATSDVDDHGEIRNATTAERSASGNAVSHADESRQAEAPLLDRTSMQQFYGAGRLALGLAVIAVAGLLLWKWGSNRPATGGFTRLVEAKISHATARSPNEDLLFGSQELPVNISHILQVGHYSPLVASQTTYWFWHTLALRRKRCRDSIANLDQEMLNHKAQHTEDKVRRHGCFSIP